MNMALLYTTTTYSASRPNPNPTHCIALTLLLQYCIYYLTSYIICYIFRSYSRNPQFVYDFQCANLGPMSELSLTETLTQIPVVQGLRVEASIDYYESLRMARIYNETYSDKYR